MTAESSSIHPLLLRPESENVPSMLLLHLLHSTRGTNLLCYRWNKLYYTDNETDCIYVVPPAEPPTTMFHPRNSSDPDRGFISSLVMFHPRKCICFFHLLYKLWRTITAVNQFDVPPAEPTTVLRYSNLELTTNYSIYDVPVAGSLHY